MTDELELSSIPESLRGLKWERFDESTQILDGESWLVLLNRGTFYEPEFVIDSIMWSQDGDHLFNVYTSTDDRWMFTNSDIEMFVRI